MASLAHPLRLQPARARPRRLLHAVVAGAASLLLHLVVLGLLAWSLHLKPSDSAPASLLVELGGTAAVPRRVETVPAPRERGALPAPLPAPNAAAVPRDVRREQALAAAEEADTSRSAPNAAVVATPAPSPIEIAAPAAVTPPALDTVSVSAAASAQASVEAARSDRLVRAERRSRFEWQVQDWLARHRHYPRAALRARQQGTAWVRFVLDRHGAVSAAVLVDSSGYRLLDRAALDLIARAAPFPPLPADLQLDEIELLLPIDYRLSQTTRE